MNPGTYWFRIGQATFVYGTEQEALERWMFYTGKKDRLYQVSPIQREGEG